MASNSQIYLNSKLLLRSSLEQKINFFLFKLYSRFKVWIV
jgi:hypothetical protein